MEGVRLTKRADALRVEGRRKRGRPRLRWEDCVKKDLVGAEWRMRARDKGVEMGGGDSNEAGLVMKEEKKSMTSIGASLTPDYRVKEETNKNKLSQYGGQDELVVGTI